MTRLVRVLPALALCAAITCLLTLGAVRASADSVSYDLTTGNSGGGGLGTCCTGPYAQVTVNLTSPTTATITFDSLTNGGYIYLIADGSSVGVNVNATSFTDTLAVGTNSIDAGFTPGPYSLGGTGNVDGMGSFNLQFDGFDGFTHSATEVTFTITDTGGTWSSASNVLTGNSVSSANLAEIHGFACAEPGCSSSGGAAFTGYASGAAGVPATPEPASMALMATFLLGAAMLLGRRLKAAA